MTCSHAKFIDMLRASVECTKYALAVQDGSRDISTADNMSTADTVSAGHIVFNGHARIKH